MSTYANDTPANERYEAKRRHYKAKLVSAIREKIKELRADETTAMHPDGLRNLVRSPWGGPEGTNSRWVYAEWFREALAELPASDRAFLLPDN